MDQFYEEALRTHPLIFIASGTFWELHELFVGTEWESIGDSIQYMDGLNSIVQNTEHITKIRSM